MLSNPAEKVGERFQEEWLDSLELVEERGEVKGGPYPQRPCEAQHGRGDCQPVEGTIVAPSRRGVLFHWER